MGSDGAGVVRSGRGGAIYSGGGSLGGCGGSGRPAMPRVARARVGRRRAGPEWHGAVSGVQGIVWACGWRSGASREGAGRPGWWWCRHARKLLDSRSAGRAPPIAGKVRGPGARGWHGEHQGGEGQLQDVVVGCFAAGCSNAHGGGHVHGIAV